MIEIVVEGKPNAKERPYFSTRNGKLRVFTPSTTTTFENFVKQKASLVFNTPLKGPLSLDIKFLLPRPKYLTWKNKPMLFIFSDKRPDIDNLIKSVVDGLKGVAFYDDAQVAILHSVKGYHSGDEGPKTIIRIEELK